MHELSLSLNILDIAAEESQRRDDADVLAIHVRIGPLSGVVEDALVSAFDLARETSPFPDCRLVIEHVPLVIYCPTCADQRRAQSLQRLYCASCDTPAARVIGGDEMEIVAMEMADRDDERPSETSPSPAHSEAEQA